MQLDKNIKLKLKDGEGIININELEIDFSLVIPYKSKFEEPLYKKRLTKLKKNKAKR